MTGFQGLAGLSRRTVCVSCCIWSVSHRQRSDFGGCEKEGEAGGGGGGGEGGGGGRVNRSFGITRDRNGFTLLIALLLVTCCWNISTAEVIFHRRDHRDQGEIYPSQRNFLVRNYGDALHYLEKYGYLENCTLSRKKRQIPDFLEEGVSNRMQKCSESDLKEALKKLQLKFELRPSGTLDDATKKLMSKGRCGNADSERPITLSDLETNLVESSDSRPRSRRSRSKRSGQQRSSLLLDLLTRSENFVEYPIADEDHKGEYKNRPHWRSNRDIHIELGDISDDPYHPARTAVPGNGSSRRIAQYQELKEKHRRILEQQQQQQQGMTAVEIEQIMSARQNPNSEHRRQRANRKRRTISILSMGNFSEGQIQDGNLFQKEADSAVMWRLLTDGISGKIPLADQRAILELSFRMWSEVIPLKFSEAIDTDINLIDVIIAFAKQNHMNCDKPFDGHGGELAHSWTAGDIHFDEDENYKRVDPDGTGINLLKVAVHEIGHVLGLIHADQENSIMYPIYINTDMYDDFELSWEDRKAVQKLYGICKGSFDLVFDWLRKVRLPDGIRTRYIYNTYFFRNHRYWMYENKFNRTRFGDPLPINRGWFGLPTGPIDAFTQVITIGGPANQPDYEIKTLFFVGDSYYRYDDENDKVYEGYPRKISTDFGPKENGTESIPNDIDAVLFDNRDSMLYFFKDEWVWTYDPTQIGKNGCCEAKKLFTEAFPMEPEEAGSTSPETEVLTGNVSAVFYSYHYHTILFLKGEMVYQNVGYTEKRPRVNSLRRLNDWYNIWFDICDVG